MSSQTPLLRTNLRRPETPEDLVPRARLQDLLREHPDRACTLVSAPAGYGKSTLVSSWLDTVEIPVAWLSLDEQVDDPRRFFAYVIAALRTIDETSCRDTEVMLEGSELPPAPVLAGHLSNDLEEIGEPFLFVIDDYHRIHDSAIHAVIQNLMRYPPRPLHLVLVTRHDPPLPMAGLRSRSGVVEIREQDLRFNREETRAAIQSMAEVSVGDETLVHLHAELEGWVVGLRLVCLALRHQDDPEGYLRTLHGGTRSTQQYLLEEVLRQQSPAFQECLLSTSILNRFCAPLCEAIRRDGAGDDSTDGGIQGEDFLRDLERANLFAIRLDDLGEWLRYHHQFQQLLQWQLEREKSPEEIALLHDRASNWFESEGLVDEALEHAVAAGNIEHAARLVEGHRVAMLNEDKWYVLERWLALLPASVRERRPGLLLAEAWIAYERFQFDSLAQILESIDSVVEAEDLDPADSGEYLLLQGEIHYWSGEGAKSRQLFEKARPQLPDRHGLVRGLLELQHGLALCMDGERDQALEELTGLVQETGAPEGVYLSRLVAGLYFVHHLSGSLFPARTEAARLRTVAQRSGIAYTDAWSSYMEACALLHANDLNQAQAHFAKAVKQRYILHSRAAVDALAGLALTRQLHRPAQPAAEILEMLQTFALELSDGQYLAVADSCKARLALLGGDLESAITWALSYEEVPAPAGLFMWLEVPVITQARILIADGAPTNVDRALDLLREVRRHSEACCFVNQTIEVMVLEALALERKGRRDEALERLAEALDLAVPGGWLRPFVEAGQPMVELLARLPQRAQDRRFLAQLNQASHEPEGSGEAPDRNEGVLQPLVEALTNRELDVLELLAQRLYDKEIAAALSITVGTVRTHVKHIYGKLEVSNRREAVAKAGELGLLK